MYPHIAAQMYSMNDWCKDQEATLESLKRIKAAGFENLQLSGAMMQCPVDWLAEQLQELGLSVCGTHTGVWRLMNETDALIEEHKKLGTKHIGIGYYGNAYWCDGGILKYIEDITPAARRIKDAGLLLLHHNHDMEFGRYQGKLLMDWLAEAFTPDELGFTLDTYWMQHAGMDPAATLLRYGKRTPLVHLKGMLTELVETPDGLRYRQRFAPPGEDNLNWDAILDACANIEAQHYVIELDDHYGRDPVQRLASGMRFIGSKVPVLGQAVTAP